MIRILLVDDHALVREGTRSILERCPDFEVVGEADSGEAAIAAVRRLKPDVVLMDLNMPGMGGFEATRQLCAGKRDCRIIVVTMLSDNPFPRQLLTIGASGFLPKTCPATELVDAIRRVHRGERYINADISRRLALALLPGAEQSPLDALSAREMDIAMRLVQGQKPQQIGEALHINPKTVSTYKSRVLTKLGLANDIELTHFFIRQGLGERAVEG